MIDESLLELQNQAIVIENRRFYETVLLIKEADKSSETYGYSAPCIMITVSDDVWGRTRIFDSFLSKYDNDLDYIDDQYRKWGDYDYI